MTTASRAVIGSSTYLSCLVSWDKTLRHGIELALRELRPAEFKSSYQDSVESLTRPGLTREEFRSAVSTLMECKIKAVVDCLRVLKEVRYRVVSALLGKSKAMTKATYQWWVMARRSLWNISSELRSTDPNEKMPRDCRRILMGAAPACEPVGHAELGFEPPLPDRAVRFGPGKRDPRLAPRAGDIFRIGEEYVQLIRKLPRNTRKLVLGNRSETPAKFVLKRGRVLGVSENFHHFGLESVHLREVVQPFVTATYPVESLKKLLADAEPISRSLKDQPGSPVRVKPLQTITSKSPTGATVILEPDVLEPEVGEDISKYKDDL